ncbi:MAG: DNA repair protein RecN [Alphaproteobacteria bacterium MarineAlpha8_Bin1]|nr:MAG: DNA repair protein RecN [Alphaproteobacteria bacterium MarineAlpha8_Bin1]|tara:strand:+ start:996 stop:2654 length:1659 start_codon:yes stop_codon:yes gene_type:complete
MLKHLSIKNLLLIDQIDFIFNQGLCVLTGETGAGKSMILDSLSLISGNRAKNTLRPPEGKKTCITALFYIKNFANVKKILEDLGIEPGEEILIKRIISSDGKSKSFIDDDLVSLGVLKSITKELLEIQSQFSEQGLLDTSTHIDNLDEYGDYKDDLLELNRQWDIMRDSKKKYEDLIEKSNNLLIKKEELINDINELQELNPKKDEFIDLGRKKKVLQNSVKIKESMNQIITNFISDQPEGIEKLMSKNLNLFSKIYELLNDEQKKNFQLLESLSLDLSDISKSIRSFSDDKGNELSLDQIDERMFLYKKISRKHRINEDSLNDLEEELRKDLNNLENYEITLKNLKDTFDQNRENYESQAKKISALRKEFANKMDQKINLELPALKLENAVFKTFIETENHSEKGFDRVIFKIKTNPKSNMDEIKNISSGGELCRIALAIRVISQKNSKSQIVFDEVDSGIGGAVSTAVGIRLRQLGNNRQVLVVTHSPQVAVLGNDHYLVKKVIKEENTKIFIERLEYNDKVQEIARMLSGTTITEEAQVAARKLIDTYN